MTKVVKGSTLARRAKHNRLAEAMTKVVAYYGCEVYHTSQYPSESGEDFAEHYMLIGKEEEAKPREVITNTDGTEHIVTNIDKAIGLLDAMFNYVEGLRFPFESGITQVGLKHRKKDGEEEY